MQIKITRKFRCVPAVVLPRVYLVDSQCADFGRMPKWIQAVANLLGAQANENGENEFPHPSIRNTFDLLSCNCINVTLMQCVAKNPFVRQNKSESETCNSLLGCHCQSSLSALGPLLSTALCSPKLFFCATRTPHCSLMSKSSIVEG